MEERFREKFSIASFTWNNENSTGQEIAEITMGSMLAFIRSELTLQKEKDAEIVRKSDQYLGYKKVLGFAANEIIKQ